MAGLENNCQLFFHEYLNSTYLPKIKKYKIKEKNRIIMISELAFHLPNPSIQYCKENSISLDIEIVWKNLLSALSFLKEKSVIHMCINPRNVLVNPEKNSVQLSDFCSSELVKFHDTVIEGGLKNVQKENTKIVIPNGWFNKYLPSFTPIKQSNFIHLQIGTTRCKSYKNFFPYLDPLIECAKHFEIEEFISIDGKIDVFSCGMVVLYFLNDVNIFQNDRKSLCHSLLNIVKSFRGPSTPKDIWLFGKILKDASIINGDDITKNNNKLGILMALQDILSGGGIISEFEKILKLKYSSNFVVTLLESINPVFTERPSCETLLSKIQGEKFLI